jgi:hypothetical protein
MGGRMTAGQIAAMVIMGLFIIIAFLWYMRNKH